MFRQILGRTLPAIDERIRETDGLFPTFQQPLPPTFDRSSRERAVGNVKTIIGKLAVEHPRDWYNVLPMVMWCLREVENETTGVAPWTLVMGHLPTGPLTILKESWCGDKHLPVSFGKNASNYLTELHRKLEIAKTCCIPY